jgi:hypothetical protein
MKRSTPLVFLTAALLSLLGANKSEPQTQWSEAVEGCRLILTADRAQYQFGDPINLHVVLQNENRSKLPLMSGGDPYDIDVFSSKGPVPLTLWGQAQATSPLRYGISHVLTYLPPGKSDLSDIYEINRAFDMSIADRYVIGVRRKLPSESDRYAWIQLFSNSITITVGTPPPLPATQPTTRPDWPSIFRAFLSGGG